MTRPIVLLAVLLVAPATGVAQPSFTFTLGHGRESLRPAGQSSGTEQATNAAASLEQLLADERVRLSYDLDVATYAAPGDWRSVGHVFGGRYRHDIGASGRTRVFAGGDLTLRRNGSAWDAADYTAAGAFANIEHRPLATAAIRAGYRLDHRVFADYGGLDQTEHAAFASALVNFETRTTLLGEAAVGSKRYEGWPSSTVLQEVPSPGSASGGRGSAGRGPGGTPMWGQTLMPVTIPGAPGTTAQRVTLLARVAQSLADRTGVSLEVTRRHVFADVAPAVVSTPPRFFDDGVYDDPYASDATQVRLSLKSIVRGDIVLSAQGSWQARPYGATPAYDAFGAPVAGVLRDDRISRGALIATVPLLPSRTGAFDVGVTVGYDVVRHRSTTALYNYTAHAVSVGFSLQARPRPSAAPVEQ